MKKKGPVSEFMTHHYRHFNAATMVDAAKAYDAHVSNDGKMMITLAGAMSTAELGISLAEMIRQNKVHAISCTGANLEEDIMNLMAHSRYHRVPDYRHLSPDDELELLTPADDPVSFTVTQLLDAENREITTAPHPMMTVSMKLPMFAPRYSILRKNRIS